MAIFSWNGATNLDLKILGQSFDFRSDVLQVSDPSLAASQFDLVEVGTDLAIVKSRDATGAPLAAADVRYAYIPNMVVRQVGVDASDASQNIVLSNGGQLWVGQRDTDTVLDDSGNVVPLSSALQSVQVWGLGGADTISTGDAADRVYGNTGADSISGGAGNDSLYGGQENDTVLGGSGNDQIAGDLGNDNLNGGSGNDVMYGGAGNDVLDPDTGNDTLFAGNGNDTVTVGNSDTGDKLIYMDKMQDLVLITSTTGDHLVYLGENNDAAELLANAGDVEVYGDGGNDSISSGNFGDDTLDGGVDDDYLEIMDGSQGLKTLVGGDGKDYIDVDDTSGNNGIPVPPLTQIHAMGGEGNDTIEYERGLFIADQNDGGTGNDLIAFDRETSLTLRDLSIQNIETIVFSEGEDYVVFADGNNTSSSSVLVLGDDESYGSSDYIDASAESSSSYVLNGGYGEDYLEGGAGADTLRGDDIAGTYNPLQPLDNVVGENYSDTLTGGKGADAFVLDFPEDGPGSGPLPLTDIPDSSDFLFFQSNEFDIITDFNTGEDRLLIDGNLFGGMAAPIIYMATDGEDIESTDNILINIGENFTGAQGLNGWRQTFVDDVGSDADDGNHPALVMVISNELTGTFATEIWYISNLAKFADGSGNSADSWAAPVAVITNIDSVAELATFSASDFDFASYDSTSFQNKVEDIYDMV